MRRKDQQTIIECALYILNKTRGLDVYHLLKILYFAEKSFILEWGHRMTADDYYAIDYGPVPTALYDATRGKKNPLCPELLMLYNESIERAGEEAPNVLLAMRDADTSYLSSAMMKCLDDSIIVNSPLPFGQLLLKSHDVAWKEAYENNKGKMSLLSIAKSAGADNGLLSYLKENLEVEEAMKKAGWLI